MATVTSIESVQYTYTLTADSVYFETMVSLLKPALLI